MLRDTGSDPERGPGNQKEVTLLMRLWNPQPGDLRVAGITTHRYELFSGKFLPQYRPQFPRT